MAPHGTSTEASRAVISALAAEWPLVGRDALVQRVLAAFESGAHGVVLAGCPGVGKTRVAREVITQLGRQGAPTEWVQATESSRTLPLGAFGPLLPKGSEASTPFDLLRQTTAQLQGRTERRRLVLAVDDAHLLDPVSATLVQQVASAGDVFVLLTLRAGEAVPDAVTSLWKDRLADRIDLTELDEELVGAALRAALGEEVGVATVHSLWSATRGNALFLHEVVLAGARSGAFHRHGGMWRWRGPITGGGKLRDVLETRLSPLEDRERMALGVLAVSEPISVEVFERLVDIEVVDALERQELVAIRRNERREEVSLAHPLYGDILRTGMTAQSIADTQDRLAEAVEHAGGRRRGDLLRVAVWRLAGSAALRPELLLSAAAEAEARFDAELAEHLARAAVERDGGAAAWHAVASALRSQGRNVEADDAWEKALELETDPAARVLYAQARSSNLFFGLGQGARAVAALDPVHVDASSQQLRDTVGAVVGMFDLYRGRIDAALAAALPILERNDVKGEARIDAAVTAAAALALRGRPVDAIDVIDGNLAMAVQDPDVDSIAAGALMATRLLALSLDGRLEEALVAARVVYDLAVDMGTHDGIAALSLAIGQIHELRGDLELARRHLVEGVALLREHDRNGYLPWCLAELACVQVLAGRAEDAREAIAEVDQVVRPELRLLWPRVETAKLLLHGLDEPEQAVKGLLGTAASAVADGHHALAAMALHEAVRLGGAATVRDAINRLTMSTDAGLIRAFAAHVEAAASEDGGALDACSLQFESMGALLLAADAARRSAACHARAGASAERAAAAHRSSALIQRLPGSAAPWDAAASATQLLSGRQLEVAALAVEGLSSRDIAARLYVSVRTIDNHLYRIYAKLGIEGRQELATVFEGSPDHTVSS